MFPEPLEARQLMTATPTSVVDLFMGYTADARAQVGSTPLMIEKINRGVALLNQTLANSKVRVSVRLVGTMETNYTESKNGDTDIARLTNLADGQMDEVTAAAITAGADVTDVIVKQTSVGGITSGNYNIIALSFLDNGVLSHEIGHTLGGNHPHGNGEDGTHSIYYAYEGTMKFADKTYQGALGGAMPYFSNPNVLFRGVPTGVAGTGPDAADNARIMNESAAGVASFRAPLFADTAGPAAAMGSVQSLNGSSVLTFNVRYLDGSGVNVDSLGNDDVLVTGPSGFSAMATLASVTDASTNFGYQTATYNVTTPGPVGALSSYSFAIAANGVSDTAGNFTAAGSIGGPSSVMPDYAGSDESMAAEEGDLTGRSWQITDEIGPKYQFGFIDWNYYRFSLSSTSTVNFTLPAKTSAGGSLQGAIYQDKNNNLTFDEGELINPTRPGVWENLPAGENYHLFVNPWQSGTIPYGTFTANVSTTGAVVPPPPVSSLKGSVFVDLNNNGTKDTGETGISGAAIKLTGTDDLGKAVNVTVTSDADGVFSFNNLRPSAAAGYTLTETQPPGTPQGTNTIGSLGGQLVPTDIMSGIVVAAGANGTGYTFGEGKASGLADLSGSVYVDANDDGIRQDSEVGIADVQITLVGTLATNSPLDTRVTKTDAQGNFTFANLPASSTQGYNISETQPANVLEGKDTAGSLGGFATLVKNNVLGFTLNGVSGTGYLFGEKSLPANPPPPPDTGNSTTSTSQNTSTGGNVINGNMAALTQINCGGFTSAPFDGDTAFSFDSDSFESTTMVNTAGVVNSAPAEVYRTQRTGSSFFYQLDNLTPGTSYTVRMHFAELQNTTAGSRVFNVSANNVAALNNFDIFAAAGGAFKAVVRDVVAKADAGGSITMNFTGVTGNAVINGLELIPMAAAVTPPSTSIATPSGAGTNPASPHADWYAQLLHGPAHASSFTLNRDGTFVYRPADNYIGPDSFSFQVVDANGRITAAHTDVNVTKANQAPELDAETCNTIVDTDQLTAVTIDLARLVHDDDSAKLTFTLGKIAGGKATLLNDCHTVRFTPDQNFSGLGAVNFKVSDGKTSALGMVHVSIGAVIKSPTLKNESSSTLPSTSGASNVLSNDVDPMHTAMSVSSIVQPAHGTASIDSGGNVVYRPNFGFHGTDAINYTVMNCYGMTATAKLSITVKSGAGVGIDPTNAQRSALDIFGDSCSDQIVITENSGGVKVKMNGKSAGVFNVTGLIAASGGTGDDTIDAHDLNRAVWLFGDDGNDQLLGGCANDILIGGNGADVLRGNAGDDRLIAGSSDDQAKGLSALANLVNNGSSISSFVHRDNSVDRLFGGSGKDTFWATTNNCSDIVQDRANGEVINPLN